MNNRLYIFFDKDAAFTLPQSSHEAVTVICPSSAIPCFTSRGDASGITFLPLEDFRDIASVQEAYALTETVCRFRASDGWEPADEIRYGDFGLWWPNIKQTYNVALMPFLENRKLFSACEGFSHVTLIGSSPFALVLHEYLRAFAIPFTVHQPRSIRSLTQSTRARLVPLVISVLQILYTLGSLVILAVRRPKVGVWAGDRVTPPRDYDFRYEDVYRELRKERLRFAEYLRSYTTAKEFFRNVRMRKRPVLYYESILRPLKFLFFWQGKRVMARVRKAHVDALAQLQPFDQFLVLVSTHNYPDCALQKANIPVIRFLLRAVGTKALFAPGGYSRNAPLMIACKMERIFTVGLQHSGYIREYHPDETGVGFHNSASYAMDVFGVWSEYWKNYYGQERAFFPEGSIRVLGHLRDFAPVEPLSETACMPPTPLRVLLISEPIVDSKEILPYVHAIKDDPRFQLIIKCRPDKNDPILKALGNLVDSIPQFGGRMEEAYAASDVVMGSNSNALLEALYFSKPIVLLNTIKWGDYFSFQPLRVGVFAFSAAELPGRLLAAGHLSSEERVRQKRVIWGEGDRSGPKTLLTIIKNFLSHQ